MGEKLHYRIEQSDANKKGAEGERTTTKMRRRSLTQSPATLVLLPLLVAASAPVLLLSTPNEADSESLWHCIRQMLGRLTIL